MIEKVKDLLYDLSDILFALLIIAVIYLAVSWKITDVLSFPKSTEIIDGSNIAAESGNTSESIDNLPTEIIISDSTDYPSESTSSNVTSSQTGGQITEDASQSSSDTSSTSSSSESGVAKPDTSKPHVKKSFVISPGATGYSVSKELEASGLVTSANQFLKRLEEREAGSKIQTGTFTLYTDDSIDTIIDILTGGSR